MQNWLMSE